MHPNSTDTRSRARLGPRSLIRTAVAVAGLLAAAAAHGHDTWFALRSSPSSSGNVVLALGTGNQFPRQEFPIGVEYIDKRGCRQDGRDLPLTALANTSTALLLRVQAPKPGPVTCWAQLVPFEVTLQPDKIALYLDEINASVALRQTWDAMHARGLAWTEHYVKNSRIELPGLGSTAVEPGETGAAPVPMGMDVLLLGPPGAQRSGAPLQFQVLRDGKALPDFAIELRGSTAQGARWLRTDAHGRVDTVAPAPGAWVLRGTALGLSTTNPDIWESAFVNLAFEVR